MKTVLMLVASAFLALGQASSPVAPYDPADPEGLVYHPNGWTRFAWLRKVVWTRRPIGNPFGRVPGVPGVTPADVQKMAATLDSLSLLLQATPEGRDGRGYFVTEARTWSLYDPAGLPDGTPVARLPLQFDAGIFPFYSVDTKKNGVWVTDRGGETESAYYRFNRLPGRLGQPVIATESNAAGNAIEFYTRPDTTRRFSGHPVADGQVLLIVRAGRDPWAPVPYGRALKAAMPRFEADRASAEQRLANLKATMEQTVSPAYEQQMRDQFEKNYGSLRSTRPQGYSTRLASMERELAYNREKARKDANPQRDQEGSWYWHPLDAHADAAKRLAAMTPDLAGVPACYVEAKGEQGRYQMRGAIRPIAENVASCRPLVMDNWGYFDTTLPRPAPQILLVTDFDRCGRLLEPNRAPNPPATNTTAPPQGCTRHVPMWQQLEWDKVAALLTP